eukprot:763116-Amphidinium_carterae.1
MLKGTLSRNNIEWHDGRHDLFDQLMDDCAGEMAEVCDEVGEPLEGSVTALPGGPGRGIPHLSLLDGTPENRRKTPQWTSPGFGRIGGPGRDGGGDPNQDPLQDLDPWEGASKKTREYSTGGKQLRTGAPSGKPDDNGDDDGRGSRRGQGDNPEDLLSKFHSHRKRIKVMNGTRQSFLGVCAHS